MANDDACLPQQVNDFVFDLSDSVNTSQIIEEQTKLYSVTFRELCSKYFSTSPWPAPQSIASECNGNPLFLAIYREVTHRHWHSVSRPNIRDRIEGWNVYRELFEELLDEENVEASRPTFYLLPEWSFDILHEFVYQLQGFCQFRSAVYASAKKHNISLESPSADAPRHILENLTILSQHREAWGVEAVCSYLERLIAVGSTSNVPGYQYLAIFSSIAYSRLECLLGDYQHCLELPQTTAKFKVIKDGETMTSPEIVDKVFGARLSYSYHCGVAYLMTRQYKDATRILGNICAFMQRGFKTGQLRNLPNSDQFNKMFDRMISLLAILAHVCPPSGLVEDSILRLLNEKHGSQLGKVDSGEGGYQELFTFACPKFISPTGETDIYNLQVRQFNREMACQADYRKLRSYLKLYTSIPVSKLSNFNDTDQDEFLPLLLSYKHKMRQVEDGAFKSALDIHYHLSQDVVHVDEAEKQRRFENYFMKQISQNTEINKNIADINTTI